MGKIKGSFAESYDRFLKRKLLLPHGLLDLVKSFSAQKVADFGCGTGTVAVGLAKEGFEVTGVDYSPQMLAAARRKAKDYRAIVDFIKADITKLKLNREFDLILCLGNIVPQFSDKRSLNLLLASFYRHLRPGGKLLLQQLNYDRILKDRPKTFAIDLDKDIARFKQYRYHRNLLDFVVTIVDGSRVPPQIATHQGVLRPWTKFELLVILRQAGYVKLRPIGNYDGEKFSLKSNDLIIMAETPIKREGK